MNICYIFKILVLVVLFRHNSMAFKRPNIVLVVADDLGWDDVSFHGSNQIYTPNIDLLACSGVALGRYYTHSMCTPSRSALLTGKYAHVTGMQGLPLANGEDRGLPLTEKLLPQYLKDLGYSTHLVGKWHIGHSRNKYLPTFRGFDSHFGHRNGFIDYYEYNSESGSNANDQVTGFALFRNLNASWETEGYVTDVYTNEAIKIINAHDTSGPLFLTIGHNAVHAANPGALLQAPPEDVRDMRHVESGPRRIYAAMVKKLDDSIGDIMQALLKKGILDNTIVAFVSDNGGMTSGLTINYASNWPLRGLKFTPYEGGVRVTGALWTSNLNISNHLWNGKMHVVDWLPTLIKAAGGEIPSDVDGVDLWDQITSNTDYNRGPIFEIDDYEGYAAIISGDYKLITGNPYKNYSNHQGDNLRGIIGDAPCYVEYIKRSKMYSVLANIGQPFNMKNIELRNDLKVQCEQNIKDEDICYSSKDKYCLFNIKDDPCEKHDISEMQPDIVTELLTILQNEQTRVIPRKVPFTLDPESLPKYRNYTWDAWVDE